MSVRHYSMHIIHFILSNGSTFHKIFLNLFDCFFFMVVLAHVIDDKSIYLLAYKRLQII